MSGFEYLSTQVKKSVRTDFLRAFGNLGSQERPLYEEEARERQVQAGASAAPGKKAKEKIPEVSQGQARDQAAEARERQLALAGTRPNTQPDLPVKIPEGEKGDSRDKAGEARERQVQNALNNQPQSQNPVKIPDSEKGDARDQAGEAVGATLPRWHLTAGARAGGASS